MVRLLRGRALYMTIIVIVMALSLLPLMLLRNGLFSNKHNHHHHPKSPQVSSDLTHATAHPNKKPKIHTEASPLEALHTTTSKASPLEALYDKLTIQQKIGQLIMMSVPTPQLTDEDKQVLAHVRPGGIILCPYNIDPDTPRHVITLNKQLHTEILKGTPIAPFISIDQEGGRLMRDPLSEVQGVTRFPAQMAFGVVNKPHNAYLWGKYLGAQLKETGVNMILGPVLDVNNNPQNPIINLRAFGSDPQLVKQMGVQYVKGIQESGCVAVGKHFPGHGDTAQDSHTILPTINKTMAQLDNLEMIPFRAAIEEAGLQGLMCAHIAYPEISNDYKPATLSHHFLTKVLRQSMHFEGITLTDDMKMDAIKMSAGEGAIATITAGGDVVLSTVSLAAAMEMSNALHDAYKTGKLTEQRIKQSVMRILKVKQKFGILEGLEGQQQRQELTKHQRTELIGKAMELNEDVSTHALLYSGTKTLLNPPATTKRIFIVNNERLLSQLQLDSNDVLVRGVRGFLLKKKLQIPTTTKWQTATVPEVVIYFYSYFYYWEDVQALRAMANNLGMPVVTLLSGSPYQIAEGAIPLFDAVLYSFGNNPASIEAMAKVCNGKLSPQTKADHININMPYG